MTVLQKSLDELCINTLRTLSVDMIEQANSGHPGLPMGAAPMAYVLWTRYLKHDPATPRWADRDRFVLSPGHGSALLYSLLHLTGYDLSLDDLRRFRQWDSRTPGHPEYGHTPGVEATTGPLGQGTANSVGMAVAERSLAARFNVGEHRVVDHFTYALVSDGDLMEGIASEAASLAGHLGLGKLIWLYDANDVSLDGPTALCFSGEDVEARHRAYGWHVQRVERGDSDLEALDAAISAAREELDRPSLIVVKTTIGYGSPAKQGTAAAHGSPLGAEEAVRAKEQLGWEAAEPFTVPADAGAHFREALDAGARAREEWRQRFEVFAAEHPELAAEWRRRQAGELPADFDADLPRWQPGEKLATRVAGGKVLNALAGRVPELFGGDADLSCSTKTAIGGGGSFEAAGGTGRNLHFGVREHAMGAVANGLAYHGGLRPYTATFFVFSDYMRPAVRLSALAGLPTVAVWTHDSVAVGEDGPTHEPIEHLASLRAMPNLHVLRPADANETAACWCAALRQTSTPSALVLSRQNLPVLAGTAELAAEGVRRGAYVLADAGPEGTDATPEVILIATGSEVHLAVEARELLAADGVRARVVSMPCWEAFAAQDAGYRERVLPVGVTARVSVEAGTSFGWSRWVGDRGVSLGIERFGASAPGDENLERFGFTAARVAAAARELLG